MPEWDGNESSCSCDCGFDIPKGGTLDGLSLKNPLPVSSGGTGGTDAPSARKSIGVYSGRSSKTTSLSSSNSVTVSISFGVTFASTPNVVVAPQTAETAEGSYGIFFYIKSISTTGCTVRLTTNVGDASLLGNVYVQWIAVGTPV